MKVHKFNLILTKPLYGWNYFIIKINNKIIYNQPISGVFNPYYELSKILMDISLNKNDNKPFLLEIDHEGWITDFKFQNLGKTIKFSIYCISKRRKININKVYIINKKLFLNEFKSKMHKYALKNNILIDNSFYDLSMPLKIIKKIKIQN